MGGTGNGSTSGARRQQDRVSNDVAGHGRVRRTGSIGLRLLLPIVAAVVGLVAGGATLVTISVTAADDARRARTLVDGAAAALRLVDEIEQEVAETNVQRERGEDAGGALPLRRARTDQALTEYLAASRAALAEAPDIAGPFGHVTGMLEPFARARAGALAPGVTLSGFSDAFEQITDHLLDLAAAIAEQLTDQRLGNLARSAALVSEIKHRGTEQRDLLRAAFVRQSLTRADLVTLAELHGDEQAKLSEFAHIATDQTMARFTEVFAGREVTTATAMRDAVLRDGDAATLAVDPDAWYVAQSDATRRLGTVQRELTATLAREAQRNQTTAQRNAAIAGGLAALVIAAALTGGTTLAVRTTRRLRRLRQNALRVARTELPMAVARVARAEHPDAVSDAMDTSHRRINAMLDAGRDEVAEVSAAMGVVHRQALRLAAEQALLRLDVSALFTALSRRGQSLVHRQLQLIDEFGRIEHNPGTLARLAALDRLAARMRRNEENLLVLAGGKPGHRFAEPVGLTDVVRAAAAEIEEYARVEVPADEDVWLAAHAVRDIVHLLAELLDNAAAFSPPHTRIRVLMAAGDADGVTVSIVDSGIGMSDAQLAESNRRLDRPTGLTSALVGTMGLLVVARLAARHEVRVRLDHGPIGGTAAEVRLPGSLLAAAPVTTPLPPAQPAPPARTIALPRRRDTALPAPTAPAEPALPAPTAPAEPALPAPTAPAEPALPAPPRPVPVGVTSAVVMAGSRTAAGLPMRRPGTHGVTPPGAAHSVDDRFPDPETVRARLTSLAGGIAAARRREPPPGAPELE